FQSSMAISFQRFSMGRSLAGFAGFEAIVAGAQRARLADDLSRGHGDGYGGFCSPPGECRGRYRIELSAPARGFFGVGGAQRAQVVGRLETAYPGELVGFIEFAARDA